MPDRTHTRRQNAGFTLIELMIVVVIVAILAGIAYPSYTRYVIEARRADGQAALLQVAAQLEKFYSQCGRYTTAITGGRISDCDGLGATTALSTDQHYLLSVAAGPSGDIATSHAITATRQGPQTNDTECGNLTYNSRGEKGQTGASTRCWKQ